MGQRTPKTPPHVSIRDLRIALRLTLDQVIERVKNANPRLTVTRASLSAVENGHRGASKQLLAALEHSYGMPKGSLRTDYEPRMGRQDAA